MSSGLGRGAPLRAAANFSGMGGITRSVNSPTSRLLWPDVAKGACIVLVVLHHTTTKHYASLVPGELGVMGDLWVGLSSALKPIRMPLFFVVSGMFASSAIHRPWTAVRRRVLSLYYLYVVWLLVFWGVFTLEVTLPSNRTQGLVELVLDLVYASTGMWFLFALALYFVLAKVLRNRPSGLVVFVAATVSSTVSFLPLTETNRVSVLFHFTFFAVGAYFPHLVRRIAGARHSLSALAVAYVVASIGLALLGVPRSVELVLLSVIGVPWGITAAVAISQRVEVATPLAWLGRRTLRVYVLHMIVLSVVQHSGIELGNGRTLASVVGTATYPVVVTFAIIGACLVIHAAMERNGLGFLFDLPRGLWSQPATADRPSGGRRQAGSGESVMGPVIGY